MWVLINVFNNFQRLRFKISIKAYSITTLIKNVLNLWLRLLFFLSIIIFLKQVNSTNSRVVIWSFLVLILIQLWLLSIKASKRMLLSLIHLVAGFRVLFLWINLNIKIDLALLLRDVYRRSFVIFVVLNLRLILIIFKLIFLAASKTLLNVLVLMKSLDAFNLILLLQPSQGSHWFVIVIDFTLLFHQLVLESVEL